MKASSLSLAAAVVIATIQCVTSDKSPIFEDVRDTAGQLSLKYVTDTGISVSETGRLKALPSLTRSGLTDLVYVKEGSYSYTSPEGKFFRVDYIADENGYRLKGSPQPIAKGAAKAPYPSAPYPSAPYPSAPYP